MELFGVVTAGNSPTAVTTRQVHEASQTSFDLDVDHQLHGNCASGGSFLDVVPHDVPPPDDHIPVAHPDGLEYNKCITRCGQKESVVVAFVVGWSPCLVRFICSHLLNSGVNYFMRPKLFGSLRVNFSFGIGLFNHIHRVIGHHAGSIFATPGMSETSI